MCRDSCDSCDASYSSDHESRKLQEIWRHCCQFWTKSWGIKRKSTWNCQRERLFIHQWVCNCWNSLDFWVSKSFSKNISRYDHPNIIAGQGTMGLEIIEQVPDVDAVVIPVGGGGLIAGCAVALKTMNPNIKIIVRIKNSSYKKKKSNCANSIDLFFQITLY